MKRITNLNDIIGQKFGRWTVLEYGYVKNKTHQYKCKCDCGTERYVGRPQLLNGKSKSCGCLTKEAISKRPINNKYQVGQRYGRLTIIESAGEDKYQSKLWKCRCDCGNEIITASNRLGSGTTRSCGCLNLERIYKHGYANTHLYKVWWGMIDRCTNEKHQAYKRYGGRGITVCDEWKNDLETFVNWAKQNGGDNPDLQLDRIDNNKGYSPNNCRFVTRSENQNNKSSTRYVTYKGETLPAKIFAEKYVPWMPYSTFIRRVFENHWSIEKTISTPTKGKRIV